MGHSVHYATYEEKVNKASVQNYWDDYASHEDWQEGCSGLSRNIRWIDYVCESRDSAEEYIRQHDKGWYDQLAVKYRDTDSVPKTSALKEKLIKQIASYKEKKRTFDEGHSLQNLKAEFISCPYCKSKLAREYLGREKSRVGNEGCPVCGAKDIRASYIGEQLAAFQERIDKWESQLKEEERTLARKAIAHAKIMWLVKVEYHV